MAAFLRRPSNTQANKNKNIIRFGGGGGGDAPVVAPPKPTKKGSFVSLLLGGGNSNDGGVYFDNGVDPLGRLSVDSTPPPPPSPIVVQQKPKDEGPKHWVDELFPLKGILANQPAPAGDLLARVRFFFSQKDPSSVDKALQVAIYAQEEGEAAVNAKLFRRFGDGLPFRVPGAKGGFGRKDDGPVPKTLRELIRAFLREHDPGFLALEGEAGLDDLLAQAAEYGLDSLEGELTRKYGIGLNGRNSTAGVTFSPDLSASAIGRSRDNSSFDLMAKAAMPAMSSSPSPLSPVISQAKTPTFAAPQPVQFSPPRFDKVRSEQPQTFVELGVDDDEQSSAQSQMMSPLKTQNGEMPRQHNFFDDKSLRADLKAFYTKHDKKKLEPQKFEPIMQWAYKIGPKELNRRFDEKYGESLTQFIEDLNAGRPGVTPGPKQVPIKTEESAQELQSSACKSYHEAKSGKSFGVCSCGFSRVDHRHITSLLVPGSEEAHFNRAKPKVVISKNTVQAAPAKAVTPSASSKAPVFVPAPVSPQKVALPPGLGAFPKSKIEATPKFEVKAEGRDGPCSDYRLDLEGRSFGVCKCGWSRPEHNKAKQQVAWAIQES